MSSNYTAVDLSKLPAPAVIDLLNFETIYQEILTSFLAYAPEFSGLVESDPAIKLLQVVAYRELVLRQRTNDKLRGVMLAYAVGSDLDHLGALMGVTRLELDPGDSAQNIPPTMESDVEFRRRIQIAPEAFSVAGPEGAYIYHALSADAEVLDASATSPSPGEVVVTVLSRVGDGTAAPDLLSAVEAALSAESVRPLTDHVTVQGAVIVPYTVQATVYTYSGPDSALVLAESRRRLDQYVEQSHRLGRDVPLSGIFSVLHSEGVQRVELTSPASDIVIDRTQAAYCTGITIIAGGVDE